MLQAHLEAGGPKPRWVDSHGPFMDSAIGISLFANDTPSNSKWSFYLFSPNI